MSVRTKDPIADSLARVLRNLGSDKSRDAYAGDWERYCAWLKKEGIDPVKAKPKHIEDHIAYLRDQGNKRPTCGRALSVIRSVYGILVRDEVVKVNPAREVKSPKFDSKPNTPHLNQDQVQQLFMLPVETWKERRSRVCLSLLFGLGWRRTEVAALRVEDFHQGTVTGLMKGKKLLTVGVPEWVRAEIAAWLEFANIETGAILPRSDENRSAVSDNIVYKIVKKAAKDAGLSITPHGLRRTNITIGGRRGVSLKDRQLAVGHASQATTERYDKADEAAENAPGQVFADLINSKNRAREE